MPDLGKPLEDALQSVIGTLTGQLEAVTNAFRSITGPADKFVAALSPGTMQVFQGAVRDLNATIGVGLLPIIQVFTKSMHEAAGILLPLMKKIQPVVQQVSQILSGLLLTSIKLIVDEMEELLPILQAVLPIFEELASGAKVLIVAFQSIFNSLFELIKGLFGGDTAGLLDSVKGAVRALVEVMLHAAVVLLNTFGGHGAVKDLIRGLAKASGTKERISGETDEEYRKRQEGPAKAGIGGALANAQFKGLEQFQKDLALAASQAVAGGAGAAKSDSQYFAEIATSLQNLGKSDILDVIIKAAPAIGTAIAKAMREGLTPSPKEVADAVGRGAAAARVGSKFLPGDPLSPFFDWHG